MNSMTNSSLSSKYTDFYTNDNQKYLYPTEFVTRVMLGNYPNLDLRNQWVGKKVLDLGFGDGRNIPILIEQGALVYGVEISNEICEIGSARIGKLGKEAVLSVGKSNQIPFADNWFDVVLACHVIYYLDGDASFQDNVNEISRVLKPQGKLIASFASQDSHIFKNAIPEKEGVFKITCDYRGIRNGSRLRGFVDENDVKESLKSKFSNFRFGYSNCDYFGINERLYWLVCDKVN